MCFQMQRIILTMYFNLCNQHMCHDNVLSLCLWKKQCIVKSADGEILTFSKSKRISTVRLKSSAGCRPICFNNDYYSFCCKAQCVVIVAKEIQW